MGPAFFLLYASRQSQTLGFVSDRLTSLKEQRAVIAEHLRWLDREIADCEAPLASVGSVGSTRSDFVSAAEAGVKTERITALPGMDDPLMLQLQEEERQKIQISKSGCWMLFSILMVGIVIVLGAWMFIRYS